MNFLLLCPFLAPSLAHIPAACAYHRSHTVENTKTSLTLFDKQAHDDGLTLPVRSVGNFEDPDHYKSAWSRFRCVTCLIWQPLWIYFRCDSARFPDARKFKAYRCFGLCCYRRRCLYDNHQTNATFCISTLCYILVGSWRSIRFI